MSKLKQVDTEKLSSTLPTKPFVLRPPIIVNRTGKPISDTVIEQRAAREKAFGLAGLPNDRRPR
jgi:hypothetical protein